MKKLPPLDTSGLSHKQARFVLNYLSNGRCARQAAIDAGYASKSAAVSAHHNLRNPAIIRLLDADMRAYRQACDVTREHLSRDYDDAIELAKGKGNVRALVSAIKGKARLFGFETRRLEHAGRIGIADLLEDIEGKKKE